jgi:sulfoxide reductase heme-binding subunit YedZ
MKRAQLVRWVAKPAVFVMLLMPALVLVWDLAAGNLSVNPIEDVTHRTGRWGLTLLLVTLAVTPVRRITGWSVLIRFRRMVGLFAFFYLLLHFSTYVVLDQFFSLRGIADDVANRPYITVGFASLVLLVPLALTSTKGMVKRLGGKRWANLHRLIYVAAAGGIVHFVWLVKADYRDPTIYGIVLVLLLASRLRFPRWRSVPA